MAFSLWLLVVIKVLIFDVDLVLIRILPAQAAVFLKYKFFVILGVIALLWLVLGNRRFFRTVAYVLFYPVVILLWKIPKLLFKNWVFLLVFSPAIHSLITSFRVSFILSIAALLGGLIIIVSNSPYFLIPAIAFLAFYLCRHGAKKIKMAFQPASVFANIRKKLFPIKHTLNQNLMPHPMPTIKRRWSISTTFISSTRCYRESC